jgi:hypothetical protein
MKTDRNGNVQWTKKFGGLKTDASYDIHIDQNGSYIMSGYTESLGFGHMMGDDSSNIFMMKTDTSGNLNWMEVYGDGLQDESFRSELDIDGGYLIPGFTTNYVFNDSTQMVIIKTDSSGHTGCHELRVQPSDSFIVMPYADLVLNELSGISTNAFTLIQSNFTPENDNACLYSVVNENQLKDIVSVFPNPFFDLINISIDENPCEGEIIISDVFGKIVYSEKISSNNFTIHTNNLDNGIYFLYIKTMNSDVLIKKILKCY